MKKIDRAYVSELDKKMAKFNQNTPKTASQQDEAAKYRQVYHDRDHNQQRTATTDNDLWSD